MLQQQYSLRFVLRVGADLTNKLKKAVYLRKRVRKRRNIIIFKREKKRIIF